MGNFFKDPNRANGQPIVTFGTYRPWSWHREFGGDGSNYPEFSGRILDLKKSANGSVEYFRKIVEPELGADFAIAVVPPSDPASAGSGLPALAALLSAANGRSDASSCLRRKTKINKLAKGGDRSLKVHLDSIDVINAQLIKGKDVLVLDDVKTSGNSLLACRQLLMQAGAKSVQCVALGATG